VTGATQEQLELQEPLEIPELREIPVNKEMPDSKVHRGCLDHRDHKGKLVHLASLEIKVRLVRKDYQEPPELLGHQDRTELWDSQDRSALKDPREILVQLAALEPRAPADHQEMLAIQERLEAKEHLVRRVSPDPSGWLERPVP
jgi:hypothetical protein